ncbi:MAG: dihydroorotate dehydrogenase electron transfer subunit [Caldanaerobacter sp.]|nr:dihydroorotate dehydrogenase electron transfer subunit [Caldanaerobacter sp.]
MKARVLSNRGIASGVYEMTFEWKGKKPHPGQFLMIDCQGKTFLKRPFSVNDFEEEKMTILYQVRGEGTKNLSQMKEGDILEITGPHGNGFEILEGKRVLIVGGGVGIAPLLYLAKKVKAQKLYIALGFKRETFLVEKFEGLTVPCIITGKVFGIAVWRPLLPAASVLFPFPVSPFSTPPASPLPSPLKSGFPFPPPPSGGFARLTVMV